MQFFPVDFFPGIHFRLTWCQWRCCNAYLRDVRNPANKEFQIQKSSDKTAEMGEVRNIIATTKATKKGKSRHHRDHRARRNRNDAVDKDALLRPVVREAEHNT